MKKVLIDTVFEIQRQIDDYLKSLPGYEFVGCGMMVDPSLNGRETVLWRDAEWNIGDKEMWASYSSCGELEGEMDDSIKETIESILKPYSKNVPFKYISNIDNKDELMK